MSDETETGLPASYEVVWGVRDRPTRGPRRGLSLEQVVAAGIHVANTEGIGGVSMGRVAKELDASAMSLYRYVGSKGELLALMVDGAFGQVELDLGDGPWRERLARWAEVELTAYRRFPWVVRIPVAGAPIMPHQLRFLEQGLRALAGTGLEEHEKLSAVLLITSFTRSVATLGSDLATAFASGGPASRVMPRYAALIRRLTPAEEYPALHAAADAGAFDDDEDLDSDHDFHFGLARVLDGIEALVNRRG